MRSPSFSWKALDQQGNIHAGTWEVANETEVRSRLFSKGYYPLTIASQQSRVRIFLSYFQVLARKSEHSLIWADILRRLALLVGAGIPLLTAVGILERQSQRIGSSGSTWSKVKEQLERGTEIAEALEQMIPPPSPYIKALIQAGERAGRLPEVLDYLSSELVDEYNYRRRLKGAFAYPLLLFLLTIGLVYALGILVLPVYEEIFFSLDAEISILTRVIFQLSHWLPFFGLFLLALGVMAFLIFRFKEPQHWQGMLRDYFARVPLFGKVLMFNDYRRFAQMLGTLLEAGIPLLEAFKLTQGAVLTFSMQSLVRELEEAARAGLSLTTVLAKSKRFPQDAVQLLEVGEESGQLSIMLHHVSKLFWLELEGYMHKVPGLVSPILIIFMTGLIGLVAVGVLLPIFDLGTYLQ